MSYKLLRPRARILRDMIQTSEIGAPQEKIQILYSPEINIFAHKNADFQQFSKCS